MILVDIPYMTEYNYDKMSTHLKFFSKKYFQIIKRSKDKKNVTIRNRLNKIADHFNFDINIYNIIDIILNNFYLDLETKTLNLKNNYYKNLDLITIYNLINKGNLSLKGTNLFYEIIENTLVFLNHLYNEKEKILKWV